LDRSKGDKLELVMSRANCALGPQTVPTNDKLMKMNPVWPPAWGCSMQLARNWQKSDSGGPFCEKPLHAKQKDCNLIRLETLSVEHESPPGDEVESLGRGGRGAAREKGISRWAAERERPER